MITKTHQDGEYNSTNNDTINGADTPIKLFTNSTENGDIKHTQKRNYYEGNSTENGGIKYTQKRYSVFIKLLYIKNKPQLNLKAWELWITHLRDNWFDEFSTVSPEHLVDVQLQFGDHHRQMWIVENAINKNCQPIVNQMMAQVGKCEGRGILIYKWNRQ